MSLADEQPSTTGGHARASHGRSGARSGWSRSLAAASDTRRSTGRRFGPERSVSFTPDRHRALLSEGDRPTHRSVAGGVTDLRWDGERRTCGRITNWSSLRRPQRNQSRCRPATEEEATDGPEPPGIRIEPDGDANLTPTRPTRLVYGSGQHSTARFRERANTPGGFRTTSAKGVSVDRVLSTAPRVHSANLNTPAQSEVTPSAASARRSLPTFRSAKQTDSSRLTLARLARRSTPNA